MTDKELLELAAKAAGIKIDKSPYNGGGQHNDGFNILGDAVLDWHNNKTWNPLTDDGDALRLAVKLKIAISVDFDRVDVAATESIGATEYLYDLPKPTDPHAATRRAIVKAAAEIGKEIK